MNKPKLKSIKIKVNQAKTRLVLGKAILPLTNHNKPTINSKTAKTNEVTNKIDMASSSIG